MLDVGDNEDIKVKKISLRFNSSKEYTYFVKLKIILSDELILFLNVVAKRLIAYVKN